MRRVTAFLFGLTAFATCAVVIYQARADEPPKPIAICTDGKCVLSEEDWNKLVEFHGQAILVYDENRKVDASVMKGMADLAGRLASCKADKERRQE